MEYKDGSIYAGAWDNDRRDGQATMKWKNGIVYEGSFYQDKRQGKGK